MDGHACRRKLRHLFAVLRWLLPVVYPPPPPPWEFQIFPPRVQSCSAFFYVLTRQVVGERNGHGQQTTRFRDRSSCGVVAPFLRLEAGSEVEIHALANFRAAGFTIGDW